MYSHGITIENLEEEFGRDLIECLLMTNDPSFSTVSWLGIWQE